MTFQHRPFLRVLKRLVLKRLVWQRFSTGRFACAETTHAETIGAEMRGRREVQLLTVRGYSIETSAFHRELNDTIRALQKRQSSKRNECAYAERRQQLESQDGP